MKNYNYYIHCYSDQYDHLDFYTHHVSVVLSDLLSLFMSEFHLAMNCNYYIMSYSNQHAHFGCNMHKAPGRCTLRTSFIIYLRVWKIMIVVIILIFRVYKKVSTCKEIFFTMIF